MEQKALLVASNNAGKIKEIKQLLGRIFSPVLSPKDIGIVCNPEETGETFEENARIKCEAFAAVIADEYVTACKNLNSTATASAQTEKRAALLRNLYVLSDDSGLCVDALDGAPGVYSARYAGVDASSADCMDKLLRSMQNVTDRKAHFVSVVVLRSPDGDYTVGEGRVDGQILTACDGDGGFGYDPVFFCDEINRPFGRCAQADKNAVSHRARALTAVKEKLSLKLSQNS